ncbi:MAG TPA: ADP-ribosylglycohydrolase family protein [Chitinophagales bacterium]|nr:ADP-ribosylglycohydrolase family protein [Chitinophagales bacterium]
MNVKNLINISPILKPFRIEIDMLFTDYQFRILKYGMKSMDMDDKWDIQFENNWLRFYRSWTGHEIYKAQLIPLGDKYCIKEISVETDFNRYKFSNVEKEKNIFAYLIYRCVLKNKNYSINPSIDKAEEFNRFGNAPFTRNYNIHSILFGLAIGDALGVPVEFMSRNELNLNPVEDFIGFGTYQVPPGTFSDDTSLSMCLAEGLLPEYNIDKIADNFKSWLFQNYWTATNEVFDVGFTTKRAISELAKGMKPEFAGGLNEEDNGNGSLMRILPLILFTKDLCLEDRFEVVKKVSSITHAHIRSVLSCFYYLEFARELLITKDKQNSYINTNQTFFDFTKSYQINEMEVFCFNRLLSGNIDLLDADGIYTSGYVIHTLEASIWCIINSNSYKESVLKAVNMGSDSDTTGAVTGGLAGILYGFENIPKDWINKIAKSKEIYLLAQRLEEKYY